MAFTTVIFWYLQYPEVFVPLRETLLLGTATSHSEPNQGTGWVFHFSNRFLGYNLLDRERLVSWSTVMVENPIVGPNLRPFIRMSLSFLPKFSCTAIALILKRLNECSRFRTF
jgi:hypothetical protein